MKGKGNNKLPGEEMSEIKITFTEDERVLLHSLVHEELYKKARDFSLASAVKNNDLISYYGQSITALRELEEKLFI